MTRWKQPLICLLVGFLALPPFSRVNAERVTGPNIILIVIDTLRPDHLPFYGYPENTAPFLSRLAARGVLFEHAHSTSSWTAPGTASILTSLHPVQHGVLTGLRAYQVLQQVDPNITLNRLPEAVTTLAEMLQEHGYATWAVADNVNISHELNFDQGFDRFWSYSYEGADTVNARITENIEELRAAEPYFLYLHYMDPHRPYHQRAPWYQEQEGQLRDWIAAYDSEIHFVDQKIGELLELLDYEENSVILVTSDHGEEFLEHDGWDHGRTLYAEVLDVPFLIYSSLDNLGARRVARGVSILDIVPTVREFVGLPPDSLLQGISLVAAMLRHDALPVDRTFFADLRCPPRFDGLTLKAFIRNDRKFIWTLPDKVELYHLRLDPGEQESLIPEPG